MVTKPYKAQRPNVTEQVSYEVWMRGSRRTSSLKVYLIFLYISSPNDEKSTAMSWGVGLSLPTSKMVFFDV
jgi:hypothetical protein